MNEPGNVFGVLSDIKADIEIIKNIPQKDKEVQAAEKEESEQRLVSFINTAERVWICAQPKGVFDKEERMQKDKSYLNIILLLLPIIFDGCMLAVKWVFIPFILSLIIFGSYIVLIIMKLRRKTEYEMPYSDLLGCRWINYVFDNNGILYSNDDKAIVKWHKAIVIIYSFINSICLGVLSASGGGLILAIILFVEIYVMSFTLRTRYGYLYNLVFKNDKNKIPYSQLSEFMTEHNLK